VSLCAVNGRKLTCRFGLLRNSTKNCCAIFWDSYSPRRKPPKRQISLGCGLMVHCTQTHPTHPRIERSSAIGDARGGRSMPMGAPENIRPRLAQPTYLGLSASTVRVPKNATAFLTTFRSPEGREHALACSSQFFAERKVVELRSRQIRWLSCGPFGSPHWH
jgi:hypothetical protein